MNNQLKKLVADFGGTHLRIGISNGLEINNISKVRYNNEASSIKLISDYIKDFKDIDQIRICAAGPCLLYTSPSPRDLSTSRMPSSA